MTTQRRTLQFTRFEDALADAQQLLAGGYDRLGQWNLSQVLGHCTDFLQFPVSGYPKAGFPISMMLWLLKATIGPRMLRKIIRDQKFDAGKPTMPTTVKPADYQSDAESLSAFASAIHQIKNHAGPWHASPLFGVMTGEEHRQLQLVHLAHHLSFLVPKTSR